MITILSSIQQTIKTHPSFNAFKSISNQIFYICIELQWLITAIVVASLHPRARDIAKFTQTGLDWYRPEYEVPIYIVGCSLIIMSLFLSTWIRQKRLHENIFFIRKSNFWISLTIWQLFLSVGSSLSFFILLSLFGNSIYFWWRQPINYIYKLTATFIWILILLSPSLISLLLYLYKLGNEKIIGFFRFFYQVRISKTLIYRIVDLGVITAIFLAVYMPSWQSLENQVFEIDQMLHWNAFVMRPMLVFQHGLVLGRDIYVQYGVGWPMVFAWIGKFWHISYGHLIPLSIIYACLYYIGLYILFRLLTRKIIWSIVGITTTLYFQLYIFQTPYAFHWWAPSATILRAPLSIWFFILLYFYGLTKQTRYLYFNGICLGLSFLFGFDTGIYLFITFYFYILMTYIRLLTQKKSSEFKRLLFHSIVTFIMSFFTISGGFILASQFQIFQHDFWVGLFEGMTQFAGGISYTLMTPYKSDLLLVRFMFYVGLYIFPTGVLFNQLFQKRIKALDIFLSSIGIYGLLTLLIFLGRSKPGNLIYPTIPFWLLLMVYMLQFSEYIYLTILRLRQRFRQLVNMLRWSLPLTILLIVILLMVDDPTYRNYSNYLNIHLPGFLDSINLNRCSPYTCDLSAEHFATKQEVENIAQKMRKEMIRGKDVAVFDDWDALFAINMDSYPKFRYRPAEIFNKKQLALIINQINTISAAYIVIRKPVVGEYNDVWSVIREEINSKYILEEKTKTFEIWKLKAL